MKLHLNQKREQPEIEVFIHYENETDEFHSLMKAIESTSHTIPVLDDNQQLQMPIGDIFYVESVDRKTFVYGENDVYRSKEKLATLLENLKDNGFVMVNRTCILNVDVLDCVRILMNSRLEAKLSNGEKLIVTRKYLKDIKACISRNGGQ